MLERESAWQGKWQPTKAAPEKIDNSLVWRFDYREGPQGTQKVRWVFSDAKQPIALKHFSLSRGRDGKRWMFASNRPVPRPAKKAEIEVYNGVFPNRAGVCGPLHVGRLEAAAAKGSGQRSAGLQGRSNGVAVSDARRGLWRGGRGFAGPRLRVCAARECLCHARSVAGHARRVSQEDRRAQDHARGSSTEAGSGLSPSVAADPQPAGYDWVPMLISLACDNRKFLVYRDGAIAFNEYDRAGRSARGERRRSHHGRQRRPMAICAEFRHRPAAIDYPASQRRLAADARHDGHATRTSRIGRRPSSPRLRSSAGRQAGMAARASLGRGRVSEVKNTGTEPADVRLGSSTSFGERPEAIGSLSQSREGYCGNEQQSIATINGDRVLLSSTIARRHRCRAIKDRRGLFSRAYCLPERLPRMHRLLARLESRAGRLRVVAEGQSRKRRWPTEYWKSLLEPAMQIDIPDEFLGNLIRARK